MRNESLEAKLYRITSSSSLWFFRISSLVLSTTGTSLMTGGACSIANFAASFSWIIAAWASSICVCISCKVFCKFAISFPLVSSRSICKLFVNYVQSTLYPQCQGLKFLQPFPWLVNFKLNMTRDASIKMIQVTDSKHTKTIAIPWVFFIISISIF